MKNTTKKIKMNSGMTYVELIVVLSIFAIMSGVSLMEYNSFQAKVQIKSLATDIALQIVQAQKDAMSGKQQAGAFITKPSYGVYFNTVATPNTITYFADMHNEGSYTGYAMDILPILTTSKGNIISELKTSSNSSCPNLAIIFKRPNSGALFACNGVLAAANDASIVVQSPKGDTATIKVDVSGRIQVN